MDRITLIKLPIEILELIGTCLKPSLKVREDFGNDFTNLTDWTTFNAQYTLKKACRIMRLTCKTFASLDSINDGVFHTLEVNPSMGALDRMKSISEHAIIRHCVKHLSFTMPQLPESFGIEEYDRELHQRLVADYDYKLNAQDDQSDRYSHMPCREEDLALELDPEPADACWTPGSQRAKYLATKYFNDVFPRDEWNRHYSSILKAIHDQKSLCEDGGFATIGGACLANMPHATSISIADGSRDELSKLIQKGFKTCTIIGSARMFCTGWNVDAENGNFIPLVLDLLAVSGTPVTQLYTASAMQLLRTTKLPQEFNVKQFNNLRVVRLDIHDDRDPRPWTKQSWEGLILPMLLSGSQTLHSLALQRHRWVGCFEEPGTFPVASLDAILEMEFPRLRRLELVGAFKVDVIRFASFLDRHRRLDELCMPFRIFRDFGTQDDEERRLDECWEPKSWWRAFYAAIRSHEGLTVKSIRHEFSEDSFRSFSSGAGAGTTVSPDPKRQCCIELKAYLERNGGWTAALARKYGKMV